VSAPAAVGAAEPSVALRRARVAELLRLAWPAVTSYLLYNSYRVNDHYWVQGLGTPAQAALSATFFVGVMNYALMYLAAGGTLALVAERAGAGDRATGDSFVRHALVLAASIGAALTVAGVAASPALVALLGLTGQEAEHARAFLAALYWFSVPMALAPAIDFVFLGRGHTLAPMLMQALAIALNYALNPLLIYGRHAALRVPDAPGSAWMARAAETLDWEGFGMAGSGAATGISRAATSLVGLVLVRQLLGVRLRGSGRPKLARLTRILELSLPAALSIAVYSAVYWALMHFVLARLEPAVRAGFGIGFQVFEGVSYPVLLGVALATASLVGRARGAGDRAAALETVRAARAVAGALGLAAALGFWLLGPLVAPLFTQDPAVVTEALRYVRVLSFTQVFVAMEAVNEKVLLGAGRTRPIFWIASLGNLARIPLCWLLALGAGYGAAGVWWGINATSFTKGLLFRRQVERREWLAAEAAPTPPIAPPER
jgi:MATE family multidrug resistance protein